VPAATRPTPITATADVFVAPSPRHGRGVFAARSFEPDETVERCPVVVCPATDEPHLAETALHGLYFAWADDDVALALGYGSLYNHSWEPNAQYETDFEAGVVSVYAFRPIAEGEEITFNYNGHPGATGELWFEVDER
jgi:uncharacterized protein